PRVRVGDVQAGREGGQVRAQVVGGVLGNGLERRRGVAQGRGGVRRRGLVQEAARVDVARDLAAGAVLVLVHLVAGDVGDIGLQRQDVVAGRAADGEIDLENVLVLRVEVDDARRRDVAAGPAQGEGGRRQGGGVDRLVEG